MSVNTDLWQCAGAREGHAQEFILEAERQRHMAAFRALARAEAGDRERQSLKVLGESNKRAMHLHVRMHADDLDASILESACSKMQQN